MTSSKFFTATNLDELKQEYRKLVFIHHPDRGGSTEEMQKLNAEYDALNKKFALSEFDDYDDYEKAVNVGEEMAKIIQAIVHIPEIEIEVCGAWLWVSGNTKPYKEVFKDKKFSWSKNKQSWYWRLPEDGKGWHKGNYTMDEIRAKYGSQKVEKEERRRFKQAN